MHVKRQVFARYSARGALQEMKNYFFGSHAKENHFRLQRARLKVKSVNKMDGSTGKNISHKLVAKAKGNKVVSKNGKIVKVKKKK